jgi:adenosine deaminase
MTRLNRLSVRLPVGRDQLLDHDAELFVAWLKDALAEAARDGALLAEIRHLVDRSITVECCLTSNVVLGAVESLEVHPIRVLIEAGVPVTLCTDDPVRLCTGIGREYDLAARLGFSEYDLLAFTRQGIAASFTTNERKTALLRALAAAG